MSQLQISAIKSLVSYQTVPKLQLEKKKMFPDEIQTERLLLRRYRYSDVDDVYAYAKLPHWGKYLPVPAPYQRSDAEAFIAQHMLKDQDKENQWAIELDGQVVGGIDFNFMTDGYEIAEFHWSIAPFCWGKGMMTEAATAVRDQAFNTVPNLHRVQSFCEVHNIGSWRVMEKIGMLQEGVMRLNYKRHDTWVDTVRYAILRQEWKRIAS